MPRNIYDEDNDASLSMSPLIDCVFLLLIFFLVTTMLKKDLHEVDHLNLPISRSSLEVPPDDTVLAIAIDADAVVYLEGEETSIGALIEELKIIEQNDPERRIRLDTDESTPFYRLVEVLDALSFRNLRNVGVRTYHEKYD
ncbi:ExbD/TolR family protein [Cerasicoccus arenae]|uniref:Biopolymer transporter ExbD n=1 Tax=Cerasicoccus arenae TaxID=424488 RepID=A0A8J3GFX6_9BACT|nr:biopolymer transporter ExbD [Cerasicoccus arenae]MBK1857865.1 biopolymer transporter ExbD [Cerasicoccus arenae]GHC09329.1 biopolymer transporter ExbD [Cerasicoccus arenae]